MELDMQTWVNIVLVIGGIISSVVGGLVLFVLTGLRNCVNSQSERIQKESDKRQLLEVKLIDEYVTWGKLSRELNSIFDYLRRIETKISDSPCNKITGGK